MLFLIRNHLEEIREGIIKKNHWQDTCWTNCYLKKNLLVVLTCWKRNTFQISIRFHLKKNTIYFETLFASSFDVLHSLPLVYLNHTELIFQDLLLYCTKKVPDNHNIFFSLSSRGLNTLYFFCFLDMFS